MNRSQFILLALMTLLGTSEVFISLLGYEFYPFSRFPMYAGYSSSSDAQIISLCLSKTAPQSHEDFHSNCWPNPPHLNFYLARMLLEWEKGFQNDPPTSLSEQRVDFHKDLLSRLLRKSQLPPPYFVTIFSQSWQKVSSTNWDQPDGIQVLLQYEYIPN
ncbi:MAG: hypothetical protein KDD61_08190 [Bdellovibrionales bacterium]|nr:hypothetical protein [Bdellovibrionales bacterium]